jgi:hypothetical protein
VPHEPTAFTHGSLRENTVAAMSWLAAGRIRSSSIIRRADPRDCQQVYSDLQAQRGSALTAVFDWSLLEAAS